MVYLGAGPALFGTQARIVYAIGFAEIHGSDLDVTGAAVNFSSSEWVWGAAAQVGMTYFLSPGLVRRRELHVRHVENVQDQIFGEFQQFERWADERRHGHDQRLPALHEPIVRGSLNRVFKA